MKIHSLRATSTLIVVIYLVLQGASFLKAEDWPRFRGPHGDGISSDEKIPTEWSDSKNLKWKLTLPGTTIALNGVSEQEFFEEFGAPGGFLSFADQTSFRSVSLEQTNYELS